MSKTAVLCLSHYEGGMELDSIKQTALFNQYGLDSILICRSNTFLEAMGKEQQIPTFGINFKTKLSWSLIKGLRSLILEQDISTLVFFGTSEIKSIYFAVKGLDCRVIVRHGTTMSSPKKDPLHRLFYSCVSDFVCISRHLHHNALDIFPCRKKQVHTIYNSIHTKVRYDERPASKTFLHVGRVEESKGVYDAIEAIGLANIPTPYKKITFVGKETHPKTKNKLITLADKLGVSVEFTGFQKDPTKHYMSNRYFIFPSYGEGLGNVIIEALLHGMICITYNNTVFPELKGLGFKQFYMAENQNPKDLSAEIESCVANDTSDDASEQSALFDSNFSDERHIKHWKELLESKNERN